MPVRRGNVSSRSADKVVEPRSSLRLALAVAIVFTSSCNGWAQAVETRAPSGAAANTSSSPTALPSARITLVGPIQQSDALARAIASLLAVRGLAANFELRNEFTEQDFWQATAPREPNRIRVWILMLSPQSARLVFADPGLERFLVRDLPVLQGLDDMGCEAIAQVIESSVVSLLEGDAALNRAELSSALAGSWTSAPEARVASTSPAPRPAVAPPPEGPSKQPQIRPRLDASYRVAYSGGFGLLHGPGLRLGIEVPASVGSFLLGAELEAYFTQRRNYNDLGLSVQNTTAYFELGWQTTSRIRAVHHLAMLGVGLNRAHVEPQASQNPQAIPESSFNHVTPWLRISNTFEWDPASLPLQIGFFVDASPDKTKYELVLADGSKQELAAGSFVRVGVIFGFVLR